MKIKSFEKFNENLNINLNIDTKNLNYEDALSEFMFDVSSSLGGGLEYFTNDDFKKLENIFKKIYDVNIDLFNLLDSKKN